MNLGIGNLAKLLVNGKDFTRGDVVMILTDEEMPLAWHYLSAQPMRVNRSEVVSVEEYNKMMEQHKNLGLESRGEYGSTI